MKINLIESIDQIGEEIKFEKAGNPYFRADLVKAVIASQIIMDAQY